MTLWLLSLFMATFIGTLIWIILNLLRPVTQRIFSQTWHYYTTLIPVFFLLGGTEFIRGFISVLLDIDLIPELGVSREDMHFTNPEKPPASIQLFIQLFGYLLPMNNVERFTYAAAILWGLGMVAFAIIHIRKYLIFKRSILLNSSENSHIDMSEITSPIKIIISTQATTPMIMGLWKPILILPDIPLNNAQLSVILSHELVHFRRHDLLVKLLVFIANAIHWFNPAVHRLERQNHILCELSCDEKVVWNMSLEQRKLYGEVLLFMLECGVSRRNLICTSRFTSPKKVMKNRLLNLMNPNQASRSSLLLSLIASILLLGSGGAAVYTTGSTLSSNLSKKIEGVSIVVDNPDGTVEAYDKFGNRVVVKYNTAELIRRIKSRVEQDIPVPQKYIDDLPRGTLKEINKTYGVKLQKSK